VVLTLSGGEALEAFALGRASSVLQALARRMPLVAHRRINRQVAEVQLADVRVGDESIVYPHDICPVDGVIIEGHGVMDESHLRRCECCGRGSCPAPCVRVSGEEERSSVITIEITGAGVAVCSGVVSRSAAAR
jgi:high-affinity K+ transport system ATPase subunit B